MVSVESARASGCEASRKNSGVEDFDRRDCRSLMLRSTGCVAKPRHSRFVFDQSSNPAPKIHSPGVVSIASMKYPHDPIADSSLAVTVTQ